jgi:predicted DNA-binding antitoxin AbrB/MazE fold protein
MIRQTIDAIFENGKFRPVSPSDILIPEGQHVRITVEAPEISEDILELATSVYDDLSDQQINEIEQIATNRRDFFASETHK